MSLCGRSADRRPCVDRDSPGRNFGNADRTRASELDHRRLRLRLHRCTIIPSIPPEENPRETISSCSIRLTKVIRATCGTHPGYRSAHPGYTLTTILNPGFIENLAVALGGGRE